MNLIEEQVIELYNKGFGVNKIASSLKLKKNKIKDIVASYNKKIKDYSIEQEIAITEVKKDNGVQIVGQKEGQTMSQNALQEIDNNYIRNNFTYLVEMIEDYKNKNIVMNSEKTIILELPVEDNKEFKTSMRVNQIVWNEFKEFCKQNKNHTQKDLISMALVEYMRKYK